MKTEGYTGGSVAPLRNVAALVELITRLKTRSYGLPGMATFYGPSGYGKTTAAIYSANKFQAYHVQVLSVWTKKNLCEAILEDMGIAPAKTTANMVRQIAENLARSDRPLLIDEADHLVAKNMIEIVRDIHESSGAPVILLGEEMLPQKLERWERVHGRMLDWVAAEPGVLEDVGYLAPLYCPNVTLDGELKQRLLTESNHSIRRICNNLDHVLKFARLRNMKAVTLADWNDQSFFSGRPPAPRRIRA